LGDKEAISVDPQDPQAIFRYSKEFHQMARNHAKAEQGGARNPLPAE